MISFENGYKYEFLTNISENSVKDYLFACKLLNLQAKIGHPVINDYQLDIQNIRGLYISSENMKELGSGAVLTMLNKCLELFEILFAETESFKTTQYVTKPNEINDKKERKNLI